MIKSRVTLKQLEAFAFVVDAGTFRAAALALGTTQPNISARIAALESALNATLFVRDAGSVRLTETGAALLERARQVIWAGEALLEEAGREELIEERLRLGVTELVACTWLRSFLRELKAVYPGLRVELEVDLSTVIDQRLSERHLDLSFQTAPFKGTGLKHISLEEEPYCWIASPRLASTLGQAPSLSDLFQHPILTHAKHTQAGYALHKVAADRGLEAGKIVHSSALSACVPMALEDFGVALLPEALVRAELASGELGEVTTDWLPDPLAFVARYDERRAPLFVGKAAEMAVALAQTRI